MRRTRVSTTATPPPRSRSSGADAQVRRRAAAGRDPLAADRVLHRLLAAPAAPRRRGAAHARGAGVRQGPRRPPGEARAGPSDLPAVRLLAGPGRPGSPRRVTVDKTAGDRGAGAAATGQ